MASHAIFLYYINYSDLVTFYNIFKYKCYSGTSFNMLFLLMKQGNVPSELPPWMKFLHAKLANPATPLNIRLFISKLIINTEEVH